MCSKISWKLIGMIYPNWGWAVLIPLGITLQWSTLKCRVTSPASGCNLLEMWRVNARWCGLCLWKHVCGALSCLADYLKMHQHFVGSLVWSLHRTDAGLTPWERGNPCIRSLCLKVWTSVATPNDEERGWGIQITVTQKRQGYLNSSHAQHWARSSPCWTGSRALHTSTGRGMHNRMVMMDSFKWISLVSVC